MATAYQTRKSILAVTVESTEGTPVVPSAGTEYLALQEDFELTPNFEELENNEIRSSIGIAKPILGIETCDASLSHYLRHSGVVGQAPNFLMLLKAAFGTETVNGTQRTTTAASSTTVVKLGAGGSDFARGFAILIKDATNGYSIRPVHSVSTNDLTLGFALANAPATGLGVGKCVNYKPADSGHQTLSLWHYVANEAALQVGAGMRVTSLEIEWAAGELVNANYSLAGNKYYFNPIVILAADTKLDFVDNVTTRVATVTAKIYRDPHELADALATSMNSLGSANTFTVTYSDSTGKFTLTSTHATFTLLWNTGLNAANTIGDKIGFSTAADDSGAQTYTSDNAQSWASSVSATYDAADPLAAKNNEVFLGDVNDSTTVCASSVRFSLGDEKVDVKCTSAETGVDNTLIKKREATVEIVSLLSKHDAEKFKNFRQGDTVRFAYNFGKKTGGNWDAGYCGNLYLPSAVISAFAIADEDGLVVMNLTVKAYVDSSGNGEVYLNFL